MKEWKLEISRIIREKSIWGKTHHIAIWGPRHYIPFYRNIARWIQWIICNCIRQPSKHQHKINQSKNSHCNDSGSETRTCTRKHHNDDEHWDCTSQFTERVWPTRLVRLHGCDQRRGENAHGSFMERLWRRTLTNRFAVRFLKIIYASFFSHVFFLIF